MDDLQSYESAFVILLHRMPVMANSDYQPSRQSDDPEFAGDLATRGSHWDLMFRVDQSLQTWAIKRLPRSLFSAMQLESIEETAHECLVDESDYSDQGEVAIRLKDHQLKYLSFQGPIGQQRGRVDRFWEGTYQAEGTATDFAGNRLNLIVNPINGRNQRWRLDFNQLDPSRPIQWRLAIKRVDA